MRRVSSSWQSVLDEAYFPQRVQTLELVDRRTSDERLFSRIKPFRLADKNCHKFILEHFWSVRELKLVLDEANFAEAVTFASALTLRKQQQLQEVTLILTDTSTTGTLNFLQ